MAVAQLKDSTSSSHRPDNQGTGKEFEIYTTRFSGEQDQTRETTWQILCDKFFSQYVKATDVVVDVGAGDGCFIRNIKCKKKIAVDLSAHVRELEKQEIEVHQVSATDYAGRISEPADVIFMSNFLEHLPTKSILLDVLEHAHQALKPGGHIVILQPNVRYAGAAYWDYVDHHIALTEHSLQEGLEINGFTVEKMIPRFLPYTARSTVGSIASKNTALMVNLYLSLPFLWRFFGHQTFVSARK